MKNGQNNVMQRMILSLLVGVMLLPSVLMASDYQISVVRRKEAANGPKGAGFQQTKASETCFYEVTVANKRFQDGTPLEARWVIFVEREELGRKPGSDKIDWETGKETVEAIPAHKKTSFNTGNVTLRDQSLTGGWVYSDGGKIRAQDTLAGVWIKLFDADGKEVGEYVNPSSLASRHKWEKVSVPRAGKK